MKIKILIIALFWQGLALANERPENVPSRLSEIRTKSLYAELFESWGIFLEENRIDKSAWKEYLVAGELSGISNEKLREIADEIETMFPSSSLAGYAKYKIEGWSDKGIKHLGEALQMSSHDEYLPEKILMSELELDKENRARYCEALFDSNVMNLSLLNYSYNVLMSVEENGILLTKGENTTIPMYVLQDELGIRTDVGIINMDLTENNEANYLEGKLNDIKASSDNTEIDLGQNLHLSNPKRNVYYPLTLPREELEKNRDKLYVVGLASQLSNEKVDNYLVLKENLENKFLLDYLTVDFNGEPQASTGRKLEANYTVPFLMLKEYYDQTAKHNDAVRWTKKLREVAIRTNLTEKIEQLIGAGSKRSYNKTDLDVDHLEGRLKLLKGNIYVMDHEVTNTEYEFFLDYLKDNQYDDLYKTASFDLTKYTGIARTIMDNYHNDPWKGTAKPPKFLKVERKGNYPSMDMSFEAGNLYCEWLTEQYNAQSDRKYKKVKFRLPSQKEWTMAAVGYADFQSWDFEENTVMSSPNINGKGKKQSYKLQKGDFLYPWGLKTWTKRNSIANVHGCYLANAKILEKSKCPTAYPSGDGYSTTSPVTTYFANQLGLFDMIGNVAEMTNIKGEAMGGSWDHTPEESTVNSVNKYDGPDSRVGFRVFMEIIEK